MKVSKHHYAIELRRRGCKVYFLNPPSNRIARGGIKVAGENAEGIIEIDYKPLFPLSLKFSFYFLYRIYMRYFIRKILRRVAIELDVVWDFEPTRQFPDLRWFGAKVAIYHPVDISHGFNGDDKNADVIFSVSNYILDFFKNSQAPHWFVNHGIGDYFENLATSIRSNQQAYLKNERVSFGYVGNLLMKYIDHKSFREIILQNQDCDFHIWGTYDYTKINEPVEVYTKIVEFIEFLKASKNVTLYGPRAHQEIFGEKIQLDGYFWCYDIERDPNKGSNSHKLLEYLSTGKVVISNVISTYKAVLNEEIIVMVENSNRLPGALTDVAKRIEYFNRPKLRNERIRLALENTYRNHVDKIESILDKKIGI